MLKGEIRNLSLFLAFVTASLFTYGLTFHQGFLGYWGLEETMFKLSFERTLFQGFVASSYLGAKTLFPLMLVSIVFFIIFLLLDMGRKKLEKAKWLKPLKKSSVVTNESQDMPSHIKYTGSLIIFSSWALTTFTALTFLLNFAGYLGKDAANDQYEGFKSGKGLPITVVHKDKCKWIAHSIVCSETHCAFLVGEQVKVWPLSDISVIESKPNGT